MTLIEEMSHGESVCLEFKESRPKESLKFVKTIVAFANGRGGRLLFGVEDGTGRIIGLPREKIASEMDAIVDAITNTCSPRISVDVKPAVVEGKSLIAVDAIREAICNAVFHRDYLSPSCVYVAVYDDRVEVVSPGTLMREITVEDACNGFSKLRNHAIGAALEYMGEVEGWGGGVSRYFTSCDSMGLRSPNFVEEAGCVKVTFYRSTKFAVKSKEKSKRKSREKGKGKSREKILRALSVHPGWTTDDLAAEIGLSRSGIEKNLRLLKNEGLLRRVGSDRDGSWEVIPGGE